MRTVSRGAFRMTIDSRRFFFDRPFVFATLSEVNQVFLNHAGGAVMKTARRSMRPGKYRKDKKTGRMRRSPSKPGTPPRAWAGNLKKGAHAVQYAIDPSGRPQVLVGPFIFNQRSDLPGVLEKGGTVVVRKWSAHEKRTFRIRVPIQARPYMGPARDKNRKNFPRWWAQAWGRVCRSRRGRAA